MRSRSVSCHMLPLLLTLVGTYLPASWAYETWHVVDVPRVVCPKQADIPQESVIQIDYTPELIVDRHHIFSFLRVSKQQVDVTFSALDSGMPPQTVVKETTVKLAALTGAANKCKCTGEGVSVLDMPYYGSMCGAWDQNKCEEIYGRPTGKFCCKPWCFVDANCTSGWESPVPAAKGKFFSFAACEGEISAPAPLAVCPWPTAEEKKDDPCNCIADPSPLFTQKMKDNLPKSYGQSCDAHDFKSKSCHPEIGFYTANQIDAWCCKEWCYVSKECSSAIPSINEGVEDKLFWSEIACDNSQPATLKRIAQCPHKRNGTSSSESPTKSVDELCKCKGVAMPDKLRTSLAITEEAYGKHCYPWDAQKCDKYYPGADITDAMWCCTSWCYVDPECPKANKDVRWSEGYSSTYACQITNEKVVGQDEQKEAISSCKWSNACDCTGSNTGLTDTWITRLGADYGKECGTHDSDCKAKWPDADWGASPRSMCCDNWCYVGEKCPLAQKSWTGAALFFNYDTCDDDKSLEYDTTEGKCKSLGAVSQQADPLCSTGVLSSEVCCHGTCGVCGGEECSMQVGGPDQCCKGKITAKNVSCDTDGPPCVVSNPEKAALALTAKGSADPKCDQGKESTDKTTCCAPTCEACGGEECGTSTGGPDNCCTGRIAASNVSCKDAGPPCVLGSSRLLLEEPSTFNGEDGTDGYHPKYEDLRYEAIFDDEDNDVGERQLSARRRGGGGSFSDPRRRSPPPDPRRRAPPANPRRRAPSKPSGSDVRRRAPRAPSPPPPTTAKAPSGSTISDARRRAPAPPPGKPAPVATDARRRSTGDIGGTRYNTQTSNVGGKQSSYGYTNKNQMQSNYGGSMPKKSNYGYSGANAVEKGSKVKMAMAAAAGVAVGVGGYYAYQEYKDYKRARDQSWCEHNGEMYNCDYCRRQWGLEGCREERNCFSGQGCGYRVPNDISRDDLMVTGFLPQYFTPPIMVKITGIKGAELTQADLKCDAESLEMKAKNVSEVAPMSFTPQMFLTLTSMDALDDPPAKSSGNRNRNDDPDQVDCASYSRPGLFAMTLVAVTVGGRHCSWSQLLLLIGLVVCSAAI